MDDRQAIHDLTLVSTAVGRRLQIRVITPPGYDPSHASAYPVLYFLHPWGLSPGYITDKLKLAQHLWRGVLGGILPPMVIVLPAGHRSFYVNAADPSGHDWSAVSESNERFYDGALEQYGRYSDYLLFEAIPAAEQQYHVRRDRDGRAIGGISMGGAAAALHAFRDPSRFCAVGIHSPALFAGPPEQMVMPWIFGVTPESFTSRDPIHVAQTLTPETQPRIWLDTGNRDVMRELVTRLHRVLEEQGISHHFEMPPGGHDKSLWEPRMADYLTFYAQGWH